MTPPLRLLGLFVTESCNLSCPYCFASDLERRMIDEELACRAIDLLLPEEGGASRVGITFWGGEPLLAFSLIERLVRHGEARASRLNRRLGFSLPTNLTLLTDEMIDFLQAHGVQLSLSLDGGPAAQALRRTAGGRSTWPIIEEKLALVQRRYDGQLPPVRMTVSPATAGDLCDNVDFFLDRGFSKIHFAPVVEVDWSAADLGQLEACQLRLADRWLDMIEAERAVSFASWDKALATRELRRRGELAEPRQVVCGAGAAMLAVDIDGRFFPCHRFVLYDRARRSAALGSVDSGLPGRSQTDHLARPDPASLGTDETLCVDCDAAERCTTICPALNHRLCGDVRRIHERLCALARVEARVVDRLEARGGAALARVVDRHITRVHAGAGILSASTAALLERLESADADRLAARADEILRRLEGRRSGGPAGGGSG